MPFSSIFNKMVRPDSEQRSSTVIELGTTSPLTDRYKIPKKTREAV